MWLFSPSLIRVFALEERHQHDLEIEPGRPVLDVIEIVLDAVDEARVAAEAVDLRPTGDSGADFVAGIVMRDFRLEALDELGALRARADEAHVAHEDVPELG